MTFNNKHLYIGSVWRNIDNNKISVQIIDIATKVHYSYIDFVIGNNVYYMSHEEFEAHFYFVEDAWPDPIIEDGDDF